jgi:hypothetical protein
MYGDDVPDQSEQESRACHRPQVLVKRGPKFVLVGRLDNKMITAYDSAGLAVEIRPDGCGCFEHGMAVELRPTCTMSRTVREVKYPGRSGQKETLPAAANHHVEWEPRPPGRCFD